ncbi:MAG: methionyl-tRNA formyltransferase, partial [Ilumatobacteraceae bacterium]
GRGSELQPSPVKVAAADLGLSVVHSVDELLTLEIDLGVVVAFGQIIKPHVLSVIPMVNLHFSLLPRWRGAAPVERALLAGDTVTGVCLMEMEEGLDTGGVYERREVPIRPGVSADDLRAELVDVGTEMLVRRLRDGLGVAEPQQGETVYAAKLVAADHRIDWVAGPEIVERVVRVGGAWTTFRGKRLKVLAVTVVGGESGDELDGETVGGVRLDVVQPEGKGPMSFADFARGARPLPGERLGGPTGAGPT